MDGRSGCGTYDIGIERDAAGQLTHRIDPEVDTERAYIGETLNDAGRESSSPAGPPPRRVPLRRRQRFRCRGRRRIEQVAEARVASAEKVNGVGLEEDQPGRIDQRQHVEQRGQGE